LNLNPDFFIDYGCDYPDVLEVFISLMQGCNRSIYYLKDYHSKSVIRHWYKIDINRINGD
jgi:hypothetical protein